MLWNYFSAMDMWQKYQSYDNPKWKQVIFTWKSSVLHEFYEYCITIISLYCFTSFIFCHCCCFYCVFYYVRWRAIINRCYEIFLTKWNGWKRSIIKYYFYSDFIIPFCIFWLLSPFLLTYVFILIHFFCPFISTFFFLSLLRKKIISCCPYLILLFSVNLFLCLFQPSFRPSKRAKPSHRWQELKRKGHFPHPSTPSLSASIAFPRIKDICWNSLV